MARLRILLADDHPRILTLLKTLLEPDYHVVGTARDGASLIQAALTLEPDVVLTDVDMPGLSGVDAVRRLHDLLPACRVIVHSSKSEPELITTVLEAGASGFLINGSCQSLLSSVRTAVSHVWSNQEPLQGVPLSTYQPNITMHLLPPALTN